MKKYLKYLLPFIIFILIFWLKDNQVQATTSNEVIMINPVYEEVFSEKEKQIILQTLNEEKEEQNQFPTYNETIYTTYNDLAKAVQQNFVNRNPKFTVLYKAGTDASFIDNILMDAISNNYINSSDAGDYLKYSMGGCRYAYAYQVINSKEVLYAIAFEPHYFTTYSQERELKTKISQYLNSYNWKQKSKYEILYDLNEYVCSKVEYDYEGLEDDTNFIKYSAYGALIKGKAVCQGYTNLYYKMLKDCGVNNIMVSSRSLNHIWNAVEYRGLWYSVDTTWNDQPNLHSKYFMKCIKDFGHGNLADAQPAIKAVKYADKNLDINAIKPGDVNEDGKIDTKDARQVLLAYVGKVKFSPLQKKFSDINKDGKVDTKDARQILLHYVGKI